MLNNFEKFKVIKIYKGGSLSSTKLIEHYELGKFVCKEVSTEMNREYGFVRFNSQIKRHQFLFSKDNSLYPRIIKVGIDNNRQKAYCIYEFKENFIPLIDYLNNPNLKKKDVEKTAINTKSALDKIHSIENNFEDPDGSLNYYVEEEMIRPLNTYKDILNENELIFQEEEVVKTSKLVDKIKITLEKIKNFPQSCFIHGNSTLENILIDPKTHKICFIDLYDETYFNSAISDFSQILQCSKYFYGLKMRENTNNKSYEKRLHFSLLRGPKNMIIFNNIFEKLIINEKIDKTLFSLMCASQFTRLLPFRIKSKDFHNAKYFYSLASHILK